MIARRVAFVAVAVLVATLAGACRRSRSGTSVSDDDPWARPVSCPELRLANEFRISGIETGAEGVAIERAVPGRFIAAWLDHRYEASHRFAAQWIAEDTGPLGVPVGLSDLPPAPATAVAPALLARRESVSAFLADDVHGCRVVDLNSHRPDVPAPPRALSTGACFAPADDTQGASVVVQSAQGWRVQRVGRAAGPPFAPPGDRWIARARDGALALAHVDPARDEVEVQGPEGSPSRRVVAHARRPALVAFERAPWGYLLAWAGATPGGASWLRLSSALEPIGAPESLGFEPQSIALARHGDEVWVASVVLPGHLRIHRVRRSDTSVGFDADRAGPITHVSLAVHPGVALVAYDAARDERPAIYAAVVRCHSP